MVLYYEIVHRLIILRKYLLVTISQNNLTDFSTQQYCHEEFPFKFFDKMVKKREYLKLINLSVEFTCQQYWRQLNPLRLNHHPQIVLYHYFVLQLYLQFHYYEHDCVRTRLYPTFFFCFSRQIIQYIFSELKSFI